MDLAEAIEAYGETYGLSRDEVQHLTVFAGVLLLNGLVKPTDWFDVVHHPDGSVTLRPRQLRIPLPPGRDYKHLPTSTDVGADDEA